MIKIVVIFMRMILLIVSYCFQLTRVRKDGRVSRILSPGITTRRWQAAPEMMTKVQGGRGTRLYLFLPTRTSRYSTHFISIST